MKDQVISELTVQLLIVKGFDRFKIQDSIEIPECGTHYPMITQSFVQKWLREIHNIHVQPTKQFHNKGYKIGKIPVDESSYMGPFNKRYDSYENALEEGLKIALNSIKLKKSIL